MKHQVHWLLENKTRSRPKHLKQWVFVGITHMETHCILLHSSEIPYQPEHYWALETCKSVTNGHFEKEVTENQEHSDSILWHFPIKQGRINASDKNRRQIHLFLKLEATGMVSQAFPACLPAFVKSRGRRKTKLYQQQDDCTHWTVVHFSMHSDRKNM